MHVRRLTGASVVMMLGMTVACQQPLHHNLNEDDANQIVTLLEGAGIATTKERDEGSDPVTFTIGVAAADSPRALTMLHARGLPRAARSGLSEAYGTPSLIPTPTEEQARYLSALTAEIEKTLETVDGVTASRVHVVLEQRDPFARNQEPNSPARASVLLKVQTGVPPLKENDIQRLVAGSVPGLASEAVTVVLAAAPPAPAEASPLVAVGPLRVSPGSRSVLLIAFGLAAAVLALISVALLRTARKLAALERQVASSPPSGA